MRQDGICEEDIELAVAAFSEIDSLSVASEDEDSDDVDRTDLVYVQPKSQIEKRIDALEGAGGSGGVGKAAEHYPTSEYFNDYEDKPPLRIGVLAVINK